MDNLRSRSALHFVAILIIVGMSAANLIASGQASKQEWSATRDLSLYTSINRDIAAFGVTESGHDRLFTRLLDQGRSLSQPADPVRRVIEANGNLSGDKQHSREDWNAFVGDLLSSLVEAENAKIQELGQLRDTRSTYEFWSAILLAVILLGESLLIFFPMLHRAATAMEEMAQTSEQLMARNAEVQTARAQLEIQNHDLEIQKEDLERINLEQQTSLQLLQMASTRFQELFHGVPFACFSINENMQIFEWNQKCVDYFGRQGFEVFEQYAPDALGGEQESEYLHSCFQQILEGKPTDSIPIKFKSAAGPPLEALLSGFTIRGASGHVSGAIIALVDVTERQQAERALNRYKHLVQQSSSGILVTSLEGEILIANASARETLFLESGDTLFTGVLHHLQSETDLQAILNALSSYSESKFTFGYGCPDGSVSILEAVVSTIRDEELNPQNYLLMIRDVTESAQKTKELAAQQELFLAGMSAMPVGVVLINSEHNVQYFNEPTVSLFKDSGLEIGRNLAEALRSNIRHADGSDLESGMLPCERAISSGHPVSDFEVAYHSPDGTIRHLSINAAPLFSADGDQCSGVIASILDVTAAKKMEEIIASHMNMLESLNLELVVQKDELEAANIELEKVAKTDGLTGLLNSRELRRLLEVNRSVPEPLAIIMLDVDHFKQYNDTYGHPGGDDVLRSVSKCLQYSAEEGTIVGRYGGEEFMVILTGDAAVTAPQVAEEIRAAIEDFPWPERPVTASIGVAMSVPGSAETSYDLTEHADRALYVSKENGRNRVTILQPPLRKTA